MRYNHVTIMLQVTPRVHQVCVCVAQKDSHGTQVDGLSAMACVVRWGRVRHFGEDVFGWSSLSKVTLPDNMETVPDGLLYGCSKLYAVKLPKSVKKIGDRAFFYSGIDNVNLHEGIEEIEAYAFANSWLIDVSLPSTLRTIGGSAFGDCEYLETVDIAEGMEALGVRTFSHCPSLCSVTMPPL